MSSCLDSSRLRTRTSAMFWVSRRRTIVEPKEPVPPVTSTVEPLTSFDITGLSCVPQPAELPVDTDQPEREYYRRHPADLPRLYSKGEPTIGLRRTDSHSR